MKYLVQSLIKETDRYGIETATVVDSFRTDNWQEMLDRLLLKHKGVRYYTYNVMDTDTRQLVYSSKDNHYFDERYK